MFSFPLGEECQRLLSFDLFHCFPLVLDCILHLITVFSLNWKLNNDWDIKFVTFSSYWVCSLESTEADLWWLCSRRFIWLQCCLQDRGKAAINTGGSECLSNVQNLLFSHSYWFWLTVIDRMVPAPESPGCRDQPAGPEHGDTKDSALLKHRHRKNQKASGNAGEPSSCL